MAVPQPGGSASCLRRFRRQWPSRPPPNRKAGSKSALTRKNLLDDVTFRISTGPKTAIGHLSEEGRLIHELEHKVGVIGREEPKNQPFGLKNFHCRMTGFARVWRRPLRIHRAYC
jgi:hypothetical protein